jgi:multiple antibiotic resistance protein
MVETAFSAFTILLVTIGPLDVAMIFATLEKGRPIRHSRRIAARAVAIAAVILLAFAFGGIGLLDLLHIGIPAFRIAGGILLLILSIDLLFARHSGISSITPTEEQEAEHAQDIAVFPLAIPLIAGPGSLTAIVLLMGDGRDDPVRRGVVLAVLAAVLLLTLAALVLALEIRRAFGMTGVNVVSRISGVILAALSVQFVLDGLAQVPLFR